MKKENKTPAYLLLYEQLRQGIVSGQYAYGTKLMSKRTAAARYGVSVITAEHAYDLLIREGYLLPKERSGYFINYREKDSFPVGQRSFLHGDAPQHKAPFPFSVYARAVRRILMNFGENVLEPSPRTGHPVLKETLSAYLARARGIHASSDQIVIGSGSEYLYGMIPTLLGRDMIYGIETPSYEKIEEVYGAGGIRTEGLPLGPDGIRSDALEHSRAGVLHITPYRSFPTGITATAAKKREYLQFIRDRDGWIVEDDFESEFTPSMKPEETLFSLDKKRVIYLNSFSKTVSPALRVAYMVLPEGLLAPFRDKLGFAACTVPTLDQLVLAELIANGDFERHLNRVRRAGRNTGIGR